MGLFTLPPEIWNVVESHLDDADRRQLCQTCRRLMEDLQQRAYRYIILDEGAESGRGVLALSLGPRAQFVRRIQYSPFDPQPVLGWEEEGRESEHDKDITLSDETREVLESLPKFVNLERFRLILHDWMFSDWPGLPVSFAGYAFNEYHQAHDEEPWRILLEDSFRALSKSAGAFSELEIDGLPPIPADQPYQAFETEEWRALLQGLKSFEITLRGVGDQGSGSLTFAHQEFLQAFPRMFLGHLSNVERLRIAATEHATIGHYDRKAPIEWQALKLPCLKTIELEYSSVEGRLVSFLVDLSDTLERIYLRHCLAESKANWKDLLKGFVDNDTTCLLDFRIVAYPVPQRSFYPTDEEWRKVSGEMYRAMVRTQRKADGWIFPDKRDGGAQGNEATRAESGDIHMSDGDSHQESDEEDEPDSDGKAREYADEGEQEAESEQEDEEEGDENEDSDDGENNRKRDKKKYTEKNRPWEEVVVDKKRRRFVVGETCESYGQIEPVELYPNSVGQDELDESDVVEIWEKLENLIQRNRAMPE